MKKNIPLAAALLAFGATTAHAQSNVTLYGVIDEGFNAISNSGGHRLYNMTSAVVSGWGVTGAEDLGGGYKAIFKLESGFELNNGTLGQGGLMFGRTAYVGMSSPYGTAMLGRQYDLVEDYVAPFAALSVFGVYTMGHPAASMTSITRTASITCSATRRPTCAAFASARCTASAAWPVPFRRTA